VILICLRNIALVGKEERNKDFNANLAEDQNGHAISPEDVRAAKIEQGSHHERISTDEA
jgi:SHS family lactate transporter-like MFS transporter